MRETSPEAEKSFRAAIDLFQKLVKESPEQREYRHRLGVCQNGLAVLLGDLGRQQEAIAVFREVMESSRQRVRDFPYIPDYRADLGDVARQSSEANSKSWDATRRRKKRTARQ